MRLRRQRHAPAILCGALLLFSSSMWAQSVAPASPKRPLSYDAYDAWWSIQGTTLSQDGQWLAYALTAQGLDGQIERGRRDVSDLFKTKVTPTTTNQPPGK